MKYKENVDYITNYYIADRFIDCELRIYHQKMAFKDFDQGKKIWVCPECEVEYQLIKKDQ